MSSNASRPSIMENHVPQTYRTASLVFYSIIFLVGSVVNLSALWVFALTTKKRNSISVYMVNVAVVDLLFLAALPVRITYHTGSDWPTGGWWCRLSSALTLLYPCLTLWLFALVSADRYVAIVQPRHARELKSVRKALLGCAGVWLMALGGAAPLMIPPNPAHNSTTCVDTRELLRGDAPLTCARLLFFFLVPVSIMLGCYAIIVHSLVHGRTSKLKPKLKQKSVRIIITLSAQVLLCFLPFHLCLLMGVMAPGGRGFGAWAVLATFLMNSSTVLDIILFYIVSKQFQERVMSVIFYRNYLRSVRRKSRHNSSNLTSAVI